MLVPLSRGGIAQAPVFPHSGSCGAGNQTRATGSWEAAGSFGFWPKGEVRALGGRPERGPAFPELWEGEVGVS